MNKKLFYKVSIPVFVFYLFVVLIFYYLGNYWYNSRSLIQPLLLILLVSSSAYITYKERKHAIKNLLAHITIFWLFINLIMLLVVLSISDSFLDVIKGLSIFLSITYLLFFIIALIGYLIGFLVSKVLKPSNE